MLFFYSITYDTTISNFFEAQDGFCQFPEDKSFKKPRYRSTRRMWSVSWNEKQYFQHCHMADTYSDVVSAMNVNANVTIIVTSTLCYITLNLHLHVEKSSVTDKMQANHGWSSMTLAQHSQLGASSRCSGPRSIVNKTLMVTIKSVDSQNKY